MLQTFLRAIEPYQRFDPAGWVSLFRFFPMWAGALLAAVGVLLMLYGGGKVFRLVACPIGAVVGLLWTPLLASKLGLGEHSAQLRLVATSTLAGLGLLFPPGVTFFAFGVPLGLVGGELAGSDWMLGFVPGFFVGGTIAAATHRYIGAVTSALVGGWLLVLGLLASLNPFTSMVQSVAQQPLGALIAAMLFAIAGAVYQLFVRLSPEARLAYKHEKFSAKKKLAEAKALENRWTRYSKDKGLD